MMLLLISLSRMMTHVTVSYDAQFHIISVCPHGLTLLYGISIVGDILTGLVIDYEILLKYCPECTTAKKYLGEHSADFSVWYKTHRQEYREYYVGFSNAMEVKATEILWKRSLENCGMRYTSVM
ncbi:hypothetical protein AVEN_215497-1 [Araneus ventricosus]|uniref:Uncharacterized protein n=1 Tax=Araneus ventricosus TaxID=182803 RepID=A0A4Y2BEU2_ARAVE|nr:hypothetical protein AVEN_215497-1 [Araneus ventricosus]